MISPPPPLCPSRVFEDKRYTNVNVPPHWIFISFGATALQWARTSSLTRFLDHTQRRTTDGRTPLDEWSARCRDIYLTTHSTHTRQTAMPPVGFEAIISAGELPQTYALDRAATGTGVYWILFLGIYISIFILTPSGTTPIVTKLISALPLRCHDHVHRINPHY